MNTPPEMSNRLNAAKSVLRLVSTAALLMVAAVDAALGAESPSTNLISSGTQFVDLLVKEDFAGAVARFDSTMKSVLPEEKLREVWQTLQKQAGPFKQRLRARAEAAGGYDIVFVSCHFEEADLDAKVVFNADRRIAGLFFVPSQAVPDSFAPPPYAKASAFREQDFTVGSGEWSLPGTLTLPVGPAHPSPAVVLVHGSGPNDRDETILANKPFRDLAWGLATKGIAVLRYEKRTKEHAAKFVATDLSRLTVKEETIDDALSAVAQLRTTDGIDPKRIFVLGHSLGGTVAPRIGQADPNLAGLIILAGVTRPLEDIMVEQTRYLLTLEGSPSEEGQAKLNELLAEVAKVKKLTAADASSSALLLHAPPQYWLDLREHDPLSAAKTLKQPLLILQGGRDYQVTEADFDGWKKALELRSGVTFKLYPELNHLFMAGAGKSTPAEYEHAGHVAESVITDIAEWILKTNPAP
jgi:dienelactone hydrolase